MASEISRLRALVSRLNAAPPPRKERPPVRLSRANRRVLLVFLSGAPNLGGERISRAAGTGPRATGRALTRLRDLGWVETADVPATSVRAARWVWRITRKGRIGAEDLLGLHAPGDPPAMMPAPVADAFPEGPQ